MKYYINLFLTIFLVCNSNKIFSQGEDPPPQQVIFLGIFGLQSNDTRTFNLIAQGTVWGELNDAFSLNTNSQNEPPYLTLLQQTGNSSLLWQDWGGWNIVTNQALTECIGYGLYKMITDDDPSIYFYYNTIDCNYSFGCGIYPPSYNPDALFKYQADENKFYYLPRGEEEFEPISNGQIINAWDMLNAGTTPKTSGFEDFWENALVATNNGSNKPRIVWGPYPNPGSLPGTITGYKVYRSANHVPGQPGTFSLLTTINDPDVFQYTDNSVTIGNDLNANSYHVKAVYEDAQESSGETSATNTVEVRLQMPQKIKSNNNVSVINDFSLEQNYPNPFNPTTKITRKIQK